jgi:hypothetical protein
MNGSLKKEWLNVKYAGVQKNMDIIFVLNVLGVIFIKHIV